MGTELVFHRVRADWAPRYAAVSARVASLLLHQEVGDRDQKRAKHHGHHQGGEDDDLAAFSGSAARQHVTLGAHCRKGGATRFARFCLQRPHSKRHTRPMRLLENETVAGAVAGHDLCPAGTSPSTGMVALARRTRDAQRSGLEERPGHAVLEGVIDVKKRLSGGSVWNAECRRCGQPGSPSAAPCRVEHEDGAGEAEREHDPGRGARALSRPRSASLVAADLWWRPVMGRTRAVDDIVDVDGQCAVRQSRAGTPGRDQRRDPAAG